MSAPQPLLMIADDSRMSRMLIKAIVLAQRPGWRIIEAASGDEALLRVEQDKPNFITMDVNMPGISGLEAAEQIVSKCPGIRIALCTANVQERMREAASGAGLFFVSKPISVASVVPALEFFGD